MFIRLNKRAQSTLEYAVIIAVVVAGLIAMQAYVKRGLQGKIKDATDDIGEQFSPEHSTASTTISTVTQSDETVTVDNSTGLPTTYTVSSQQQERAQRESVGTLSQENW